MLDPPPSTAAAAAVAEEGMEGAPVSVDGGQDFGSSAACDYRVTGDFLLPVLFFCFFYDDDVDSDDSCVTFLIY